MSRVLFAWDIDGTLLSTGGAGRAALNGAFAALHGVPSAFAHVEFAGRTDPGICQQAFAKAGLPCSEEALRSLQAAYLPRLEEELARRAGDLVVHPGVRALLDASAPLGTHALLTGNWKAGAMRKLQAVGLWDRFSLGAFGDDSPHRNDLVPVLRERAREAGLPADEVVVIGDTEADLACARAGGALAVLVGTGWRTMVELKALDPDLLLEDLEKGSEPFMEAVVRALKPRG
jgi:phosphoglycolate phosphatase-like HAD superfamily hydrolase